jgi:hypothetical protein
MKTLLVRQYAGLIIIEFPILYLLKLKLYTRKSLPITQFEICYFKQTLTHERSAHAVVDRESTEAN